MSYVIKIDGREVTAAERDQHLAKKRRLHGGLEPIFHDREAPGANTDTQFLAKFGRLYEQLDGNQRHCESLRQAAMRQGYTPGEFDVYLPTLAKKHGDPRAFVRSRGEAVKLAEERGTGLCFNGEPIVPAREPETDPWDNFTPLAENRIRHHVEELIASDPSNATRPIQELREQVIDKYGNKE
jgi:hypothetical protein